MNDWFEESLSNRKWILFPFRPAQPFDNSFFFLLFLLRRLFEKWFFSKINEVIFLNALGEVNFLLGGKYSFFYFGFGMTQFFIFGFGMAGYLYWVWFSNGKMDKLFKMLNLGIKTRHKYFSPRSLLLSSSNLGLNLLKSCYSEDISSFGLKIQIGAKFLLLIII